MSTTYISREKDGRAVVKTIQISYTHGDTLTATEVEALQAFRLMHAIATDTGCCHTDDLPDDTSPVAMLHLVGLAFDGLDVAHIQHILAECSRLLASTVCFNADSADFREWLSLLHEHRLEAAEEAQYTTGE